MPCYLNTTGTKTMPDDPILAELILAEHAVGVWRRLAGGVPGQPQPDSPEPGVPDMPFEPGEPTIPDQPPPAPIA
jgi:hypothetical protein